MLIAFQLPPVLNGWMFMKLNQKESGEVQILYLCSGEDLAACKVLTDSSSECMTTCKSRDGCQKLLNSWKFWLWT